MTKTERQSSMIVGMIGAVLFVFSVSTHFAFAGYVDNPVYATIDSEHFICEGAETWFEIIDTNVPDNCGSSVSIPVTGAYTVVFYTGDCSSRTAGCNSGADTGVISSTKNFQVLDNTVGTVSFLNTTDISPTDMLATVQQGTVETAGKTLPLLVFLGIPLGFLIVLFLINMINKTLTPVTSQKSHRGNGRGWTAHGAMEHDLTEFKKKTRSRLKRDLE